MSSKITLYDASGNPVELSGDELKELLNIQDPIGVNQTWQDVTNQRALDTEYTNDTGRSIMVSCNFRFDDSDQYWIVTTIQCDGLSVAYAYYQKQSGDWEAYPLAALIPHGSVYKITVGGSSDKLTSYRVYELR